MIGIVVVAHENIANEMVNAVKKITPEANNIVGVDIDSNAPVALNRQKISEAIKLVDPNDGVVLLSDMFGGTPSNLCLSFLSPTIEVISGFNLPMLIKLVTLNKQYSFEELVEFIQRYGQKNIVIASKVLNGQID